MGRSVSNDPQQQYKFKVEIEGVSGIGFSKVDGLESELEVVEYREGGYGATRKLPGIEKTGTVTLEKGAFKDKTLYQWFRKVATSADFRKTITITEQDRLGNARRTWTLYECWASKVTNPSLDASASEIAVESIEIQYESMA
jgi:phage tail-like protein